ncbi:MAG: type II toxin-antitoxin system RelE/ParE family toxin [Epsilonproteobacteria bacterium]|nr:type II toxin-antitoxin system RelE/ParE family toxin [Campylobacterota bacterium]
MIIEKKPKYIFALMDILNHIKKDKPSASKKFEKELNRKINSLIDSPFICRPSYYFDDKAYRDLVYQGYTIIYKIETERILILEIFKWIDR